MTTATKPAPKKKMGRPTIYTKALADKICDLIRTGLSEAQICSKKEMPGLSTIGQWKVKYPDFRAESARATAKRRALERPPAEKI